MQEQSRPLLTRASQIRPGDERCFDNPRFNYIIEDVSGGNRLGDVRIEHGDGAAVEYLQAADLVWIRKGGR